MKCKIGYYIKTDIQHIPPIIKIYEKLGGIIFTKNDKIYNFILENHSDLNPEIYLVRRSKEVRKIAYENDIRLMVYTGFQILYWGWTVQVFHGVSDKHYVEDGRILRYDLCLVPGQKHIDKFKNAKLYKNPDRYKIVGYAKFDDIINNKKKVTKVFDNDKPVILYAPTWISQDSGIKIVFSPHGESSLPVWGKKIIKAFAKTDWNLIIKYHSRINNNRMEIYDEIESYIKELGVQDRVKPIWDSDITKYMKQADILISDISAVCYEWFHFDKPIIFANPAPQYYKPSNDVFSNTYAWNAGDVIYKEEEIIPLIEKNLKTDEYKEKRNKLLKYAFYKPDGKALQRQVEEILKLCEKAYKYPKSFIFLKNIKSIINDGVISVKRKWLKYYST